MSLSRRGSPEGPSLYGWACALVSAISLAGVGLSGCNSQTALDRGSTQLKTLLFTPGPTQAVVTAYQLPSANSYLGGIVTGPDNNLWVTEGDANKIARVTAGGAITEFADPTVGAYPALIILGPDGNLWYSEYGANNIGRITTAGTITEFPFPAPPGAVAGESNAQGITTGPDGNMWFAWSGGTAATQGCQDFTTDGSAAIEVMSTSGNLLQTYTLPTNTSPEFIVQGPDGNLWFTEDFSDKIGRITPSGQITEFKVPTPLQFPCADAFGGMAVGPDGDIWFTERWAQKIGKISTSGVITEYGPFLTGDYTFTRITAGADGNMWFAQTVLQGEPGAGIIAKMDTSGNYLENFVWPSGGPHAVTVGPDNNIWYTDQSLDQVGEVNDTAKAALKRHHR